MTQLAWCCTEMPGLLSGLILTIRLDTGTALLRFRPGPITVNSDGWEEPALGTPRGAGMVEVETPPRGGA